MNSGNHGLACIFNHRQCFKKITPFHIAANFTNISARNKCLSIANENCRINVIAVIDPAKSVIQAITYMPAQCIDRRIINPNNTDPITDFALNCFTK